MPQLIFNNLPLQKKLALFQNVKPPKAKFSFLFEKAIRTGTFILIHGTSY